MHLFKGRSHRRGFVGIIVLHLRLVPLMDLFGQESAVSKHFVVVETSVHRGCDLNGIVIIVASTECLWEVIPLTSFEV